MLEIRKVVVFPFSSTSNHNQNYKFKWEYGLYFLSLLHQTTTSSRYLRLGKVLYFLSLLHQTTTLRRDGCPNPGCISFLFYIKPQLKPDARQCFPRCISFLFYIKPQLSAKSSILFWCCISFLFYIKPQPSEVGGKSGGLYFLSLLHQTTTYIGSSNGLE